MAIPSPVVYQDDPPQLIYEGLNLDQSAEPVQISAHTVDQRRRRLNLLNQHSFRVISQTFHLLSIS